MRIQPNFLHGDPVKLSTRDEFHGKTGTVISVDQEGSLIWVTVQVGSEELVLRPHEIRLIKPNRSKTNE